jgi:hypothetical protein
MYVLECSEPVTADFAEHIRQTWRIASALRVPLPLILGPGMTVKEIKR